MPTSVTMPALGESVTEGTVTRWLKQEGEQVEVDEPLLEVSTDKVDTEIPSPAAGVLTKILVAEDETVDVGAELAVIGGDGDGGGAGAPPPRPRTPTRRRPPPAGRGRRPRLRGRPSSRLRRPRHPRPRPRRRPPTTARAVAAVRAAAQGTPVTMPALGESVTEGTVTRWLKAVGDEVTADEPLLEVSTDKVDTEIPAPVSGTLLSIAVGEDETVEVGAELAVIGSASAGGGAAPRRSSSRPPRRRRPPSRRPRSRARRPRRRSPPRRPRAATTAPAARSPRPPPRTRRPPRRRSPRRRRPSRPRPSRPSRPGTAAVSTSRRSCAGSPPTTGVDLSTVTGTGVGGRIRKQDVLAAAEQAAPAPAERRPRLGTGGPVGEPLAGRPARHLAARPHREDAAAAQGHRAAHGRVAGDQRAAHHRRRGRRHEDRHAAHPGEARLRGPRGRQAVVPAVLREGRGGGAQVLPVGELVGGHGGRHGHLPRRREPRHRRRHRARPARPGHPRRRRPEHRRAGPQDRRPRGPDPQQQGQPRRARRRHLHADQHRQPRRALRHPDHQPAAGGDPRHRARSSSGRSSSPTPSWARSSRCARWCTWR